MNLGKRLKLARDRLNVTQEQLASRSGVSQAVISALETRDSKRSQFASRLAAALAVPVEWLQDGDNEPEWSGNTEENGLTNRVIKARQSVSRSESNVEPGPDIRGGVPLISWVQAGAWSDVVDNFAPGQAEEWLPSPRALSSSAFALRVRGESMKNPHGKPSYDAGDIIYVDPKIQAKHGDRVVVRLDDSNEATFKQLIIEGEKRYLKALNPAWPEPIIEINGNATICGVVMGRWVPE